MGSKSNRLRVGLLAAALGMVAAVGCDDSQPLDDDATMLALAGTWEAVVFEYTSQADTLERVDLIDEGGSATLVILANGAYTLTVTPPSGDPNASSGFMLLDGGFLFVTDNDVPGETTVYGMNFSGDTLALATDEVGFDFDGDSVTDPAFLELVLERQ
ncbi:MAG: hypothetical protein AMS21_12240 [Gemmatimonas sp. SG8_38_2]|nr:MAG: hypothetical protein AMS21_12240 [Gemmatimonas sp. SG8_38_2]